VAKEGQFSLGRVIGRGKAKEALGKEFAACCDGAPCTNCFLLECSRHRCHFGHKLKTTPPKAVIDGVVSRLSKAADECVKEQSK